ncbi:hypothetical protein SEA_PATIO_64 [Gordonia phage Patio]|uniref:Uncharacterized protein n=2 Tax=Skysandvirus TaxID=2948912 RepID=A0A2D2W4M8_9CAUD|nr:hypothetical protein KNT76_gp64 [Gordonia phage Patio]YP_010098132.1 hypothetical protein KNU08_gp64 [Gordonia phage Skysand]ATS93145.1 hypothetical protein SEA_PATIO_64 [Gordonia phage Patio]AXQ62097.1 hypothetical protein SEA_SKYSAND_64 [Gordonia phage Skysand]QRI45304.1 hypothetical protein SEA_ENNEA_69 [Gordonia phage Ennea]
MIERHLRCTPDHVQCSAYHARLVDEYRQERYRQEIECEYSVEVGGRMEFRDSTNTPLDLITFKKWLIGSRGGSWA